jgi:sRNA-binding protein
MSLKKRKPKKKAVKRSAKKKVIKRKVAKRAAKRAPKKRSAPKRKVARAESKPKENVIGLVTHYFPHVQAAVVKLKAPLTVGDSIKIKGHTTDFTQTINSIQMDHVSITEAKKGMEIGLQVASRVRQHDRVIKI